MREIVKAKRDFDKWLERNIDALDGETARFAGICQFELGMLALNAEPLERVIEDTRRDLRLLEEMLTHGT